MQYPEYSFMSSSSSGYTLDTNAIIYYLKDDKKASPILEKIISQTDPIYISTITELELFGFSFLDTKEVRAINQILSTLSILPLDSHIARLAGSIRSKFGVKAPDAAIAATALFTGSTLLTRNVKDFQKIPELFVQKI